MRISRRYYPISAVCIAFVLLCGRTYGSTRTIEFTNKEGEGVNDLHIKFSNKTSVTSNPFGNDKTPTPNDVQHNFWGMTVNDNASVKLSFQSTFENLTIGEWWWTQGGTANMNGTQKGTTKKDTNGTSLSFLNGPASGDGQVLVSINAADYIFTSVAGFSAAQSAIAFDSFLKAIDVNGFALINSTLIDSITDQFVGNLLGDPATELSVQILHQDSTQPFDLTPLSSVPEPSTLVLLGCGLVTLIGLRDIGTRPIITRHS